MVEQKNRKIDLIAKAAIKIFADKGYHSSRTHDIAKEAGVGYGLIYHYFSRKDDILLYIFRESWEHIVRRAARVSKSDMPPMDKLLAILDVIFQGYRTNPDLMKVLVVEVPDCHLFRTLSIRGCIIASFLSWPISSRRGQQHGVFRKDVSPVIAAFVIYGAIDTTIRQCILDTELGRQRISIDETKYQIVKLLCGDIGIAGLANVPLDILSGGVLVGQNSNLI